MQKTKVYSLIYIHEIILNNDKYPLNIHLKHFNLEEIRQGNRAATTHVHPVQQLRKMKVKILFTLCRNFQEPTKFQFKT